MPILAVSLPWQLAFASLSARLESQVYWCHMVFGLFKCGRLSGSVFRPPLLLCAMLFALAAPAKVWALEEIAFAISGAEDLVAGLERASLLRAAEAEGRTGDRDIIAAALADYERLLGVLYANGRFGATISIKVDGREAADLSPVDEPAQVRRVLVRIETGPRFRFGIAEIGPLAPGTVQPDEFARGQPASTTAIQNALDRAIADWRDAGHAKADLASQAISANHASRRLDARLVISPGRQLRFGNLVRQSASAVRDERIARIAGLPSGDVFSPQALDAASERLRRTGAFASVRLVEDERIRDGDLLDIGVDVTDMAPRRFGFGAELSSLEGVAVSGFWMHRNFFGGAERLRFDGEISDIGGSGSRTDLTLAGRLDIPAAIGTDIDAFFTADAAILREPAYDLYEFGGSGGIHRWISDEMQVELAIDLRSARTIDDLGKRRFLLGSLPTTFTWDRRDDLLDPARGTFLLAELKPTYEAIEQASWIRAKLDGRTYVSMGEADRAVLALRGQAGTIFGAGASNVPPDDLFFSGGSGTVRGYPYQSLGVRLSGGDVTGGRSFLGASAELRLTLSNSLGMTGFVDYGRIGADGLFGGSGRSQTGAGAGLRYFTTLGPIRLDVAVPVSGPGKEGPQFYLGIGQAF